MHLGTLIARLESEADAGEALEALGDIVLFTRVLEMGERWGETPAAYTAGAVARFAAAARDDDWLSLLGALGRSPEPGRVALVRMLEWALAHDAAGPEPAGGTAPAPAVQHDRSAGHAPT